MRIEDIRIRSEFQPGDLQYVISRHGDLYREEYHYGVEFETYVRSGMKEFTDNFDPYMDKVWICRHDTRIIGFLLLMHRANHTAQLRYFYLEPEYRGMGLGKRLMELFMDFFYSKKYRSAYLWTTHEQTAAAALYTRYGFKLMETKASTAFGKPLEEQRYEFVPDMNGLRAHIR